MRLCKHGKSALLLNSSTFQDGDFDGSLWPIMAIMAFKRPLMNGMMVCFVISACGLETDYLVKKKYFSVHCLSALQCMQQ